MKTSRSAVNLLYVPFTLASAVSPFLLIETHVFLSSLSLGLVSVEKDIASLILIHFSPDPAYVILKLYCFNLKEVTSQSFMVSQ